MSTKATPRPWKWTAAREEAAELLAEGKSSKAAIARRLHIGITTLGNWCQKPEFQARVEERVATLSEAIEQAGIKTFKKREGVTRQLLDRLTDVVEQITLDDLKGLKTNPIQTINLWLRIKSAVETTDRRRYTIDEEYDDDFPVIEDLAPEVAQKVLQIVQREESESAARRPPGPA